MSSVFKHLQNRSLAHVMRFNLKPQHFPESVSDHSYFVAYIVSILCHLLGKQSGHTVDKQKALEMALVHDMEEMFSGDIVTPFKIFPKSLPPTMLHCGMKKERVKLLRRKW